MTGRDAIHAYWSELESTQDDISFGSEILSVGGERAFVHWWVSYLRKANQQRTRLDGMFLLLFDAEGRCRSLREWWHADPPFPA